jgi:hypothetical protein
MNSARGREQLWHLLQRRVSTPIRDVMRVRVPNMGRPFAVRTFADVGQRVADQAAEDYDEQRPGARSDF